MNLVDAFREIAPVEGTGAVQARRREAAALIYDALCSLAAKMWQRMDQSDRDDAASEVLLRMMNNGPRGCREGDPASGAAVRAYLRESVRNGLRDLFRRRKHVDMPEGFDPPDTGLEPSENAAWREAQRRLAGLERQLLGELVPAIASRSKGGRAFAASVQQLVDIREGRLHMDELITCECGSNPDDKERKRARNRIDQRFSRVFARIHDALESRAARDEIEPEDYQGLRAVLDSLRLRQ